MAERVRERLRAEDGDLGTQRTEARLVELTGLDLGTWLSRAFFVGHVRRFKYRPTAWQLCSALRAGSGKRQGGGRQEPAFACLVYAHRAGLSLAARVRTQYVALLLNAKRGRRDSARQAGDDTAAAQATTRVEELERFTASLHQVEDRGFACPELEALERGRAHGADRPRRAGGA
ncbi:MAG: hypothetical protein ACRDG4_16155 [Chloroflexota bacterium]